MEIVLLIVLVVILGYLLYLYFHAEHVSKNTIICFTGSLGCGKTYLAVKYALKAYKLQRLKYKLYKFCPLFKFFIKGCQYPATLYSNIPVRINRKTFSTPLTKEHILMLKQLPERAVVLIDEFGQLASQWEFSNPLVMQNLQTLVRFFRHFTDGRMFLTDQNSGNMVKPIRDRLGVIYYLNDFHRIFGILPLYQVSCIPLLNVEDSNTRLTDDLERYFCGFLPYRWLQTKKYESRCYKNLYYENAEKEVKEFTCLTTNYLPDISVSQAVEKDYKVNKDKYKDYLYNKV